MSTAAARALAEKFGGDRGAADWRHFGRLAGFTNRKAKYLDASTGLYPFVRLIEAGGGVYPEAERFLTGVKNEARATAGQSRERLRNGIAQMAPVRSRGSEEHRRVPRRRSLWRRRNTSRSCLRRLRFSHGATAAEVEAAIRSRDLSHKGNERRQNDYVERTIKKALATIERGR